MKGHEVRDYIALEWNDESTLHCKKIKEEKKSAVFTASFNLPGN